MKTVKIEYTTTTNKVFRTIANCELSKQSVETFLNNHYNMDAIVSYTFKPSVKQKYARVVNYRIK